MLVAVLVSAVPFALTALTLGGGVDYLPIVSFATRFIGVDGRYLLPLDFLVAGGLPLLALVAAAAARLWWPTGMAGAALLATLAVVNLVVFARFGHARLRRLGESCHGGR